MNTREENLIQEHEFAHYAEIVAEKAFADVIAEFVNRLDSLQRENEILKMQNYFATVVAHELRTPVSVIESNLELIASSVNDPEIVSAAYKEAREMANMITGLVYYNEVGENYVTKNEEVVAMSDIVGVCIKAVSKRRSEKKNNIKMNVVDFRNNIRVDSRAITHVLDMIIDNACVYSPEKTEILIYIERDGDSVKVRIVDQGYGIPDAEKANVFTKFFRATNASLGKNFGTGMSLHMAKKIVEAHEGKIGFETTENHGSTFWFTLPKAAEEK